MTFKLVKFANPDFALNMENALSAYRTATIDVDNPSGISLLPDDLEYDNLVASVSAFTQYQELINDLGNNNFVQFAANDQLDLIGDSLGIVRESDSKATTTMRFTFTQALTNTKTIFANTSVYNSAGTATVTFYTDEVAIITAGQTYFDIAVTAESAGTTYNNYGAGEIDTLATPIEYVDNVSNLLTTSGGGDIEKDEAYKKRIRLANNQAGVGTIDGFRSLALGASTELVDVGVIDANAGASPNNADVYILKRDVSNYTLHSATAYAGVITSVGNVLNNTKNRPLNTTVNVYNPEVVRFTLTVACSVYNNMDLTNFVSNVQSVITEWRDELRNQLGAIFYKEILQARIEKIPEIVQATVTVTWNSTTPNTPKVSEKQVLFLDTVPTPTISQYIDI